MYRNYKDLPKNTKLYTFDQLSNELKVIARKNVLYIDLRMYNEKISKIKSIIKINIHLRINSNNRFKYLIDRKKHIVRANNDINYCDSYIINNLCHFTIDGIYVTYMIN